SRHRRERIANLVRDAGRHLADRGEPLLDSGVALELFDRGDVLEREEQADAAARCLEVCRTEADLDLDARVAGLEAVVDAARRRGAAPRGAPARPPTTWQGSCAPPSTGRPTTAWNVKPVIVSAARLNVRIRCDESVVAKPLGRLSMTC